MGADAKLNRSRTAALATKVAGKRSLLHPAMHSGFLVSFEGSCLSVCQPRFDAALRESPASAAGLNQQELNDTTANPIAHRCDLLTSPKPANLQYSKELRRLLSSRCL